MIPGTNAFEFKNITRAELVSVLKKVKASIIRHQALIRFLVNYLKQQGTP